MILSIFERFLPLIAAKYLLQSRWFWTLWAQAKDPRALKLRQRCVLKVAESGKGPLKIRLINGVLMKVNPFEDRVIARQFLILGFYELGTVRSLEGLLQPGEVYLDVGANVGEMVIPAGQAVGPTGRVIAVEPNPHTAALLRHNIALNGVNNVTVVEAAIANRNGTIQMVIPPSNLGGVRAMATPDDLNELIRVSQNMTVVSLNQDNLGKPVHEPFDPAGVETVEVRCTRLDDLAAELGISRVGVIKMDVEGFELEAIRSASVLLEGADPPVVTLEYSNLVKTEGGCREDIFRYFAGMGWSVYKLKRSKGVGGELIPIPTEADAPEHENLYFVPPGRAGSVTAYNERVRA